MFKKNRRNGFDKINLLGFLYARMMIFLYLWKINGIFFVSYCYMSEDLCLRSSSTTIILQDRSDYYYYYCASWQHIILELIIIIVAMQIFIDATFDQFYDRTSTVWLYQLLRRLPGI